MDRPNEELQLNGATGFTFNFENTATNYTSGTSFTSNGLPD